VKGRLARIPRHPRHRDLVLAILARNLRRRHPYTETEINDYLATALAALNAAVDHVTCRRYLVDLGFVRRDRAGARYLLNFPKIEATLSAEAAEAIDVLLAAHRNRTAEGGGR